jgi:hypothetical protein
MFYDVQAEILLYTRNKKIYTQIYYFPYGLKTTYVLFHLWYTCFFYDVPFVLIDRYIAIFLQTMLQCTLFFLFTVFFRW